MTAHLINQLESEMNTYNEFERRIAAARGIIDIAETTKKIAKANSSIQTRRNIGYSGHADFSDYPNAKDFALYMISAGLIGVAIGAVYTLFEYLS